MNYIFYQAEDFAADERFVAYFLKTDEEAMAFWSRWISEHAEKLDEILNAEQLLGVMFLRLEDEQYELEYAGFESFLEANPSAESLPLKYKGSGKLKSWIAIAAAAVLILAGGMYFFQQRMPSEADFLSRRSGYGQLSQIVLSDGSRIFLNSNSILQYPKVFTGPRREVILQGEAYFEVAKDKSHPFIVRANGLKTRVYGTRFNVEAYKDQPVNVALVEGSVGVQSLAEGKEMMLTPAQCASFNPLSHNLQRSTIDTTGLTAWKEGVLVFKNASFEHVANKIKNLYGIQLLNKTKDQNWNYTGRFKKTDYLTVVQSICFAKRINYTQQNQTITFIH